MPKVTFHIVTIFPESMRSYLETSVLGKAIEKGAIAVSFYNPRDHAADKHKSVDDTPYGGGAGMVMMAEPILRAVQQAQHAITDAKGKNIRTVVLSAKGEQYTQTHAEEWAATYDHLILIAGRYEGIDERVTEILGATEVSVGPYVLTDGELPAMIIASSVARLVPGVITFTSLEEESRWTGTDSAVEYPHYTRPEVLNWEGKEYTVPEVLLSGDHKKISAWRTEHRK